MRLWRHRIDGLARGYGRRASALLVLVLVGGFVGFVPVRGQSPTAGADTTSASLEDVLRGLERVPLTDDGRLFELRAPQSATATQLANQPIAPSVQAAPSDTWDDRFSPPGVTCCAGSASVFVVEVAGNDVFVGGGFSEVGRLEGTSGIAQWNGRRWLALAGGLRRVSGGTDLAGSVYDLALSGNDLYVVGGFNRAGDLHVSGIARWNIPSQTWNAVGSGVGPVDVDGDQVSATAVALIAGEVYIGGGFDGVDGVEAYRVARWNGTSWSPLAGGVSDATTSGSESVQAIVGVGDLVYVGGKFEYAVNPVGVEDVLANNIAIWNRSTERWSALGGGVSAPVATLALDGGTLYAGGAFANAGGQVVNGVARWDGAQWSPLGAGASGSVSALVVANGALYAGGAFYDLNGVVNTNSIARWDGAQWQSLRSDLLLSDPDEDSIYAVGVLANGNVFVGGEFSGGGDPLFTNLAYFNGTRWRGTGMGFEDGSTAFIGGDGYAVVVNAEGQVFVGGDFTEIGGLPYSQIAMWDGNDWHDIGGANGPVSALLVRGDELFVGGGFSQVGNGVTAVRVAKYNMRTKIWSALGDGLPGGYVNTLAFVGNTLYAGGGGFPSATECCLWKWDGAAWSPFSQKFRTEYFSGPFGAATTVRALASDGQRLLVGGVFLDIELRENTQRFDANDLLLYDPATDSIGLFGSGADNGDVPSSVEAITFGPDGTYFGGEFTSIDGVATLNIARLNANGWAPLGTGVLGEDPIVGAIVRNGTDLFVGGSFETAGVEAFNIARWDTVAQQWSALGCGIARNGETVSIERVADLAVQPANRPNAGLYAAGGISAAGCAPSIGFAVWYGVKPDGSVPGPQNERRYIPMLQR